MILVSGYERCQKPIDGSHQEGGVYGKTGLAGILISDSKHWYQMVPQVIMKRVWWRESPPAHTFLFKQAFVAFNPDPKRYNHKLGSLVTKTYYT